MPGGIWCAPVLSFSAASLRDHQPFSCAGESGVDPFDKTGIWMIEGFASGGGRSWAIGKALAPGYPDLQAAFLEAGVAKLVDGGPRAALYELRLTLRNGGDGKTTKSVGRVYLVSGKARASAARRRPPIPVKRIGVRRLAPGQSRKLKLRIRVPGRGRGYPYVLSSGWTRRNS
jgi:hypothetical protein